MSILRLANLEGRVERILQALDALRKQLGQISQQLAQLWSQGGGNGGGGGDLIRIWLPTGVGAGTFGSPASASDAVAAAWSGNGWTTSGGTTITVYNSDTTAVGANKAGWAQLREDGTYHLIVADC